MLTILPHEISCALLIYVLCQKLKDNDGWGEVLSKESQRKILITILKLIQSSDIKWKAFLEHAKETCPEELFIMFTKEVMTLEDADQLLNIFKSLEELTVDQSATNLCLLKSVSLNQGSVIKRTSILGLFIRKLVLKFKKMSFQNVNNLFKAYNSYRDSNICAIKRQSLSPLETSQSMDLSCADESTAEESMLESTKEDIVEESNKENIVSPSSLLKVPHLQEDDTFLSRNNILNFIEEHVELLESNNAFKPHLLQKKIEEIQRLHSDITNVYYLSFLNYLGVSEVNKATKMLCLYFDYKVFHMEPKKSDMTELEKHQTMFKRFRYCALNLGVMHCCHRNYSEALMSLEEAIRVAQETNDDQCLKHAMFWLNIVKEETGQLRDCNIQNLFDEISKEMYTEDEQILDSIQDIDCLGMLRYSKILAFKGMQSPCILLSNISRIIVSNTTVTNSALLTRSSLLDFYGFKVLSAYNCQVPLQTLTAGNRQLTKRKSHVITEENLVVALCHLALHHWNLYRYIESSSILEFIKGQLSLHSPNLKLIKKCSSEILFDKYVKERKLEDAIKIADFRSVNDEYEGMFMSAIVDVVRGNFSQGFKKASFVKEKIENADLRLNPILNVNVMLLFIEIKLCSLNPTQVVNDILHLLSHVETLKMYGARIDVNICLIRYHMMAGLHEKALEYINHVYVETLANGNSYHHGLLYYYQAKCLSALSNINDDVDDVSKNKSYQNILSLYEKAFIYFQESNAKARLCNVYYEQAFVFHEMSLFQERNAAATQYRALHENIKNFSDCMLY